MKERFTLREDDVAKWLKNTAVFLAPAGLIFLISLQAGKSLDESLIALKLWALNVGIDLIKKFIAEN